LSTGILLGSHGNDWRCQELRAKIGEKAGLSAPSATIPENGVSEIRKGMKDVFLDLPATIQQTLWITVRRKPRLAELKILDGGLGSGRTAEYKPDISGMHRPSQGTACLK
jgi:hypothetical protein